MLCILKYGNNKIDALREVYANSRDIFEKEIIRPNFRQTITGLWVWTCSHKISGTSLHCVTLLHTNKQASEPVFLDVWITRFRELSEQSLLTFLLFISKQFFFLCFHIFITLMRQPSRIMIAKKLFKCKFLQSVKMNFINIWYWPILFERP